MSRPIFKATVTRGLKILQREKLTLEELFAMDYFEEGSKIPDLGKATYLALREYYKELQEKEKETNS